jgi:hypothetical protein
MARMRVSFEAMTAYLLKVPLREQNLGSPWSEWSSLGPQWELVPRVLVGSEEEKKS